MVEWARGDKSCRHGRANLEETSMSESPVTYTLTNGVALIQMDDGKANALSYEMLTALNEALDRADAEAQSVVLAGRPGRFCAGFDLKTMTASPNSVVELLTAGSHLMMRLYGFPLPVIIACSGHAIAGGALLTDCGDIRIGIEGDFRLGMKWPSRCALFSGSKWHGHASLRRRCQKPLWGLVSTPAQRL